MWRSVIGPWIDANMRFPAFLREFDLLLSLGKARTAIIIKAAMTVWASDPFNI